MHRPGFAVRRESAYREHDAELRRYWESGENPELTQPQRARLGAWCERATGTASDHGSIVFAVAPFVHEAMPRGEIEGVESPRRPLGWIVDSGVGEPGDVPPPDTVDKPGWVCINAVTLAAAMLRELGYPVRECNVYLAQAGSLEAGFRGAVYQQAAMQVWFEGAWHWADAYLPAFDAAATRDDRSPYKVDVPCHWTGTAPPGSWRPAVPGLGWEPFALDESTGPDLQRRFFPRGMDTGAAPRVLRPTSLVDRRGGTATSGVFLRTAAPEVRLALEDARGR
jgi:hypothetical protein